MLEADKSVGAVAGKAEGERGLCHRLRCVTGQDVAGFVTAT